MTARVREELGVADREPARTASCWPTAGNGSVCFAASRSSRIWPRCLRAFGVSDAAGPAEWPTHLRQFADQLGRPVFCTRGDQGIFWRSRATEVITVAGYPVSGPTDPVGAGTAPAPASPVPWRPGRRSQKRRRSATSSLDHGAAARHDRHRHRARSGSLARGNRAGRSRSPGIQLTSDRSLTEPPPMSRVFALLLFATVALAAPDSGGTFDKGRPRTASPFRRPASRPCSTAKT